MVPTLSDYGEPQLLEVFKNTLPTRLYLSTIFNRRFKISSRDSQKNPKKENTIDRAISRSVIFDTIHEHK